MKHIFAVVVLTLFSCAAYAQTAFAFQNQPGAYSVGLRVVAQYDRSREYKPEFDPAGQKTAGERSRPIQTAVWYPAKTAGKPMRYDDYLQLLGWDDDFARPPEAQAKVVNTWLKMVSGGKRDAQLALERNTVLWAVRDAEPENGRYPVVIYSPSISSNVFENAEMMEFIASHGYIVLASPALGVRTRGQRADLAHAEAQAADIRFLADYAATLPNADTSRIAAMGFSWGGLANVLAAAKDSRIQALICLDGTVRYQHAIVQQAVYVRPEQFRIPLLYVAQRPAPFERSLDFKPDHSGSYIRSMSNADRYLITMYAMEHPHFATSYIRLDPLEFDEYSRDEVAQAHGMVARYVLHFLNGTLLGNQSAMKYLLQRPEQMGAPAHSTYSQFFQAKSRHPGSIGAGNR